VQVCFFIDGNQIENVESFSHLGHIIDSRFKDSRYILFRRNSFATQANKCSVLFSGNYSFVTRIKLFKAFCSRCTDVSGGRLMTVGLLMSFVLLGGKL